MVDDIETSDDYMWEGDTWTLLDRPCEECGNKPIETNSKMRRCLECDWWVPVGEHGSRTG